MGRLVALAGLLAFAAGCVQGSPPVVLEPGGSARAVFVLPRSAASGEVSRVTFSTTGTGGASFSTELTGSQGVWQGVLRGLPPGTYTFDITALDTVGTARFETESQEVLLTRQRPALIIQVGQEPGQADPVSGMAPLIHSVTGSAASIAPGGTVSLRAQVSAGNTTQAPSYQWEADGGTFDNPAAEAPVWTAPAEEGRRTLRLVARDPGGATVSLSFTIDVSTGRSVVADGPVVFNRWPMGVDPRVLPSKNVAVGQQVSAQIQAVDADGDMLRYTWAADCQGSLEDSSSPAARFTPSALPPVTSCDNCRLLVSIEDLYGGRTESVLGVCVQPPLPPSLVSTSSVAPTAIPGEVLRMRVEAADPLGGPLTFTWTTSTGILGTVVRTGNSSEVPWTVLSCIPAGVPPTLEVTVANSLGLSVSQRFEVNWNGPVCGHPPCEYRLEQQTLTAQADCITDTPLFIPDGHMLDGAERTLTAVDPVGGHFTGAILRNRGPQADVSRLKLRARGLLKSGPCDGGDDRLRGILLQEASGSVTDSEVLDIRRNQPGGSDPEGVPRGCQEGHAIEVRNPNATTTREVQVLRNQISGYQKVGVVIIGKVTATVSNNVLNGGGPVGHIARNGIQLSDGATGRVEENQVSGHSYTGADVATGILVMGGPYYNQALSREGVIEGNTLMNNDIGIYLSQADADGNGPATPTRIRVVGNTLSHDAVTNGYVFQAAISDFGGGNIISANAISGPGYDPATQPGATFDVDVVAETESQVAFLTPSDVVAAQACSGRVVVQSQDAKGNLVKPAQTTFNLSASGTAAPGLVFYSDAGCQQPITTVNLGTGQAEAAFYFKAVQPGTASLTVSNGSVSGQREQTISGT
jgi:hypothetical protein